jgi:hypothetical protein
MKSFEFSGSIRKTDAKRGIVYAEVYAPLIPDTQNDFASAAEIEKAAHKFMASGRADHIDYEHDLKKTGSVAVESFIAGEGTEFTSGAWVLGIKPDAKNADRIAKGEVRGVSMYGAGARKAVQKDGKTYNELHGLDVQAVSWVRKPANRTQNPQFVTKSEGMTPAERELLSKLVASQEQLAASIERLQKALGVGKSSSSPPTTDVRKAVQDEHDARREVQIAQLRKSRAALHSQLEEIWGAEGAAMFTPAIRRAREAELCIELDKCDRELARLDADGIDWARHDGFSSSRLGGSGTSETIRIEKLWPNDDSAYALDPSRRSKPEDSAPLPSDSALGGLASPWSGRNRRL